MVSKSILVVLGLTLILSHSTGIKISSDGGYTDIVIKIKDEVPEDRCPQILQNLKVSSFHYRDSGCEKDYDWEFDVYIRYAHPFSFLDFLLASFCFSGKASESFCLCQGSSLSFRAEKSRLKLLVVCICKRTHLQGFITWDTLCHRIIISLLFEEKNPRMLHFARNNNKALNIFQAYFSRLQ